MSKKPSRPRRRRGSPRTVVSAGCVVYHRAEGETKVLLGHRRDGGWIFPKGKLEQGERPRVGAKREVLEETGLEVVIRCDLGATVFAIGGGALKFVHWFAATPVAPTTTLVPDQKEIVELFWLPLDEARLRLTHQRDRLLVDTLAELLSARVI